jgi:hypothetical protein
MLAVHRYLFVFIMFFSVAAPSNAADAPYVTTPQTVIDAMLNIGAVAADDHLIDLGSGDGRIVITAAKQRGARGMGVELDANLVRTATREARREGVQDRVSFVSDDLFFADLSKASVITVYMSEAVNLRLRPSLFKLKPGTRVVSHDFEMGNWQPDAKITVAVPGKRYGPPSSQIFLWRVPADFSGTWTWRLAGNGVNGVDGVDGAYEAVLAQKFQKIDGKGRIAANAAAIGKTEVKGDVIHFVMGAEVAGKATWREFQGRIQGDTITGTAVTIVESDSTAQHGVSMPWRATRIARGNMDIEAGAQPFGSGFFTKE